ncbi:MAG: grasp-with-spasm system ATP-grasp peptide maturase [Bacteroidia bacterium]|nr:grasp-with-spasm system ATP-grasp peptide maturase [Bacteroidia bacterium]
MILILSTEKELLTQNVINWLLYYNIEFKRFNDGDITNPEINISNNTIKINFIDQNECSIDSLTKYWYRRGYLDFTNSLLIGDNDMIIEINKHKTDNDNDIINYIHYYLQTNVSNVNSFNDNSLNKLTELTVARKLGIKIPDTLITTNKNSVLSFIIKHKKVITKPIKRALNFKIEGVNFYTETHLLTANDVMNYPNNFSPIKLQNYIEKAFELRVFYLDGVFYSSAIFSQNDEQTKIDFRNYNESNPNRVLPFNMPKTEEAKFRKLMKALNLNSGSLDIIVTKDGEYVFLEVNPVGQFTQVSFPCNYYLEKQMAISLSKR